MQCVFFFFFFWMDKWEIKTRFSSYFFLANYATIRLTCFRFPVNEMSDETFETRSTSLASKHSRISNQRSNQRTERNSSINCQHNRSTISTDDESRIPFAVVQFNYNCGSWRVRRGWLGAFINPLLSSTRGTRASLLGNERRIFELSNPFQPTKLPPHLPSLQLHGAPHWNRQKDPSPPALRGDARSDGGILKVARWLRKWVIKVAEEKRSASGSGKGR